MERDWVSRLGIFRRRRLLMRFVGSTVLSSAGNDGRVRLWRSTYGNVWRPMGSLDVVQSEDAGGGNGDVMEE